MDSIRSLDNIDPRVAGELLYTGSSPAWTCVLDNRFCYFLYIPRNYYTLPKDAILNLIVLIHGSGRNPYTLRREFAEFAEKHGCALLAPLFPVGLIDPQDTTNYKLLKYKDIRYDEVLLAMIEEAHARYARIDTSQFYLYGYSGGGQFAHRFAYRHPRRIRALACGAPGTQTLLDWTQDFPDGVKNWEDVFGSPALDLDAIMKIPTMFIAGDQDTDIFYAIATGRIPAITKAGGEEDEIVNAKYKDGRYGATKRLYENWIKHGAKNSVMHTVQGAKHEEKPMLEPVRRFFEQQFLDRQSG